MIDLYKDNTGVVFKYKGACKEMRKCENLFNGLYFIPTNANRVNDSSHSSRSSMPEEEPHKDWVQSGRTSEEGQDEDRSN